MEPHLYDSGLGLKRVNITTKDVKKIGRISAKHCSVWLYVNKSSYMWNIYRP